MIERERAETRPNGRYDTSGHGVGQAGRTEILDSQMTTDKDR